MFRKNRIVTSLLFACMLCFCLASIASAHAALAESAGGTLVKFMFSDGTTVKGARIIVYDANQEQIGKGKVDKEGIFDYAEYAGTAAALYMNDGEGHSVTYEIPADAEQAAATEAATEKQTEAAATEAATEKQTEAAVTEAETEKQTETTVTEAATEKQTEATVTEAVTEKQTEDLEEEKPSKTEKKEKTARDYLESTDYSGKRILLVEDNELNREIASEILQMTGVEVEYAENGKIAVEKVLNAPANRYDLAFMDIQMPVMNGYEATAAIRGLSGERGQLPIVAMTANAFAEDVQMAKNAGMNGHIAKPLDVKKLTEILKKWL